MQSQMVGCILPNQENTGYSLNDKARATLVTCYASCQVNNQGNTRFLSRALPTDTKVESGMSQSNRGPSAD